LQENEDYKKRVLELRKNLREATQQIKYLKEAVTADPKAVQTATAADTPLNGSMASFNNAYMSHTLNFEDPSAVVSADQQHLLYGASSLSPASLQQQQNQLQRKRSGSASRSGRSPDAGSVNNQNTATASNAARLRRSGSAGSLPVQSPLGGEWNASTKDSAIRDDWMNGDNASLSVTSTSPSRARSQSGLNATQKGGLSIVAPVNWLLLFRAEVQKALDEGRCREMTLNEVTETVQKLYQSKVIANEKASRGIGKHASSWLCGCFFLCALEPCPEYIPMS
jgi:hypothetical protein